MYQFRDTGPALGRHQYELVFTEAQPRGRALDELASLSFVEQIDLVDDGQVRADAPLAMRCSFSSSSEMADVPLRT